MLGHRVDASGSGLLVNLVIKELTSKRLGVLCDLQCRQRGMLPVLATVRSKRSMPEWYFTVAMPAWWLQIVCSLSGQRNSHRGLVAILLTEIRFQLLLQASSSRIPRSWRHGQQDHQREEAVAHHLLFTMQYWVMVQKVLMGHFEF